MAAGAGGGAAGASGVRCSRMSFTSMSSSAPVDHKRRRRVVERRWTKKDNAKWWAKWRAEREAGAGLKDGSVFERFRMKAGVE